MNASQIVHYKFENTNCLKGRRPADNVEGATVQNKINSDLTFKPGETEENKAPIYSIFFTCCWRYSIHTVLVEYN